MTETHRLIVDRHEGEVSVVELDGHRFADVPRWMLPRATRGWRIHSIGAFTSSRGWYTIVVLTQDNPAMTYGVTTIQNIARVIHRDLNPGATSSTAAPALAPAALTPDELIPALPAIP